jgi:NAD(P)-dependent dehydrogenase (short-subunit alcohol dehydrogenase family)
MPKSRFIVITGATRGLGRAMADELIRLGHTVAGCGRSADGIVELQRQFGPPHVFDLVDVASDDQVQIWAERILKKFGPPDVLLNNAAVINRNAPLWKVSAREFSEVVAVNIHGVANVIRHFVPTMVERHTGVIVNFSSGWGRSAEAEVAPYCASKWAVEGLTQALAQELPVGMAAVALNPGIINTEMLQSCFGSSANQYPTARQWAQEAVPFLLRLGPRDNGQPLTVPG